MDCPTCGVEMSYIGGDREGEQNVYLCRRCGTVRCESGGGVQDYVPQLVERCQIVADHARTLGGIMSPWFSPGGIQECLEPKPE